MPPDESNFVEMPVSTRDASIGSFDDEKQTAEMVFSTGAQVRRYDWMSGSEFYEELSLDPAHAKLERVADGAVPFLKDHGSSWRGAVIADSMGRVIEARADGKRGIGKVLFSSRAEVQPFIKDIRAGVLKSVSVGYRVNKFEKAGEKDGIPILRATDWELFEVSLVAMPADSAAQFRSAQPKGAEEKPRLFKCEVRGIQVVGKNNPGKSVASEQSLPQDQNTGEITMTEAELKAMEDKKRADAAAEEKRIADAKAEGAKAERARGEEIRKMVRAAKLEDSFAEKLIKEDVSLDAARTQVIDKLAEGDKAQPTRGVRIEGGDLDEVETRRGAVAEAILHRGDSSTYKVTERSRAFVGMSLMETARELLRLRGVNVSGMSKMQLAQRAMHSTSDFPSITENVLGKVLRDAFLAAPQTFAPIVKEVQLPDFKQVSRVQLGLGSSLTAIGENGELTYGTMGESKEVYGLTHYGKGLSVGYQALVNDDLEAFVRVPAQMGAKARSLESDLVWSIFNLNAAMGDGVALFHASHGNLAAVAAAIAIGPLGIGRAAVRAQKEMDGEPLNLAVRHLMVPVALETVAEQYISVVQPNVQTANNPFAAGGRTPLNLIVEPRLGAGYASGSDTAWYLAAAKEACDLIEFGTLQGSREPEITRMEEFDTFGVKMRVSHSAAAKALDWRGLFKNPGA